MLLSLLCIGIRLHEMYESSCIYGTHCRNFQLAFSGHWRTISNPTHVIPYHVQIVFQRPKESISIDSSKIVHPHSEYGETTAAQYNSFHEKIRLLPQKPYNFQNFRRIKVSKYNLEFNFHQMFLTKMSQSTRNFVSSFHSDIIKL